MDTRFIYSPEVKTLIDSFSAAFSVKITFFTPSGNSWLFGCSAGCGTFCTLLQENLGLYRRCKSQDEKMCAECGKRNERIVYTCYSGLSEAIVPIYAEGKLMFYAMIGQFRTGSAPSNEILSLCGDGERERLSKAFLAVPAFTPSSRDAMLSLFEKTVSLLISTEQVRARGATLFETVAEYVRDNIREDIRLDGVADYVARSTSSVSHEVKKRTGLSFKGYVTEEKIKAIERAMREDETLTVKEASALFGYRDSLYFSRLYRSKRGFPPSVFRLQEKKGKDKIGFQGDNIK